MSVLQIAKVEAQSLNLTAWLLKCNKDVLEAFVAHLTFLQREALQWSIYENAIEEIADVAVIKVSIDNSNSV